MVSLEIFKARERLAERADNIQLYIRGASQPDLNEIRRMLRERRKNLFRVHYP
jgi:hypothetical protein